MPERLPDWLTAQPERTRTVLSPERKALMFAEFEMVFPRVLEMVCAGYTVKKALQELPIEIDRGAFMTWLRRDPERRALYNDAKEVRTEAWADEIIKHATGVDDDGGAIPEEVSRSRLIIDSYWKLMGADNRKQYGETKKIEMETTISITSALQQAHSRVIDVVATEVDLLDEQDYKQLPSGDDDADD